MGQDAGKVWSDRGKISPMKAAEVSLGMAGTKLGAAEDMPADRGAPPPPPRTKPPPGTKAAAPAL